MGFQEGEKVDTQPDMHRRAHGGGLSRGVSTLREVGEGLGALGARRRQFGLSYRIQEVEKRWEIRLKRQVD